MVLDKHYDEILEYFIDRDLENKGLSFKQMKECLEYFGKKNVVESLEFNDNKDSILTVPSLNHRGFLHYIVYTKDNEFLDPSTEKYQYDRDAPLTKDGLRHVFAASCIYWD